jgi:hypothetical protein
VHGRFLHGEWFLEGQRCPGGDHSAPLPAGLSERLPAPADFPEMRQRLDIFDGCPNQFAYGDNFYQIAVWRAKTASWAKHRLADACDAAAAASSAAAATAATAAAAAASGAAANETRWMAFAQTIPIAARPAAAAATTHRLSAATACHALKLASSAADTAAAAHLFSGATVLSPAAAAAAADSAKATCRLAAAAASAASTAEADSLYSVECAAICAAASMASAASASATIASAAAAAVAEAYNPAVVEGLHTSAAAAAAIAASPALNGIVRLAIKLVEHHGKSGCDGNSNTPVLALKHAIEHQLMGPNPGTRQLVHFLAEHKPFTSTPKASKRGWEAIGRIFYGYMDTIKFTKLVVPDADGSKFGDSKKHSSFVGRHTTAQV